jgi:hypothetical protein
MDGQSRLESLFLLIRVLQHMGQLTLKGAAEKAFLSVLDKP